MSWSGGGADSYNIYKGTTSGGEEYLANVGCSYNYCTYTDYGNTATTTTTPPTSNTATTSLPVATAYATSVEYNGYIYELGGGNAGGSGQVNTVYYAQILSNGTIGGWNTTSGLPVNIEYASTVAYNGYIYEIGGWNASDSVFSNVVYYASINSNNGTLGGWSYELYPISESQGTSVEYNGYIYVIGGSNATSNLPNVYYAKINSDGSTGSWISTTSLQHLNMY